MQLATRGGGAATRSPRSPLFCTFIAQVVAVLVPRPDGGDGIDGVHVYASGTPAAVEQFVRLLGEAQKVKPALYTNIV